MNLEQFDQHPAWGHIDSALKLQRRLMKSVGPDERDGLYRIRELGDIARAYRSVGTQHPERFNDLILDPLAQIWTQVEENLEPRQYDITTSHVINALVYAERTILQVAMFPQIHADSAQEARIKSIYEDLRVQQTGDLVELRKARQDFAEQVDFLTAQARAGVTKAQAQLESIIRKSDDVTQGIVDDRARIDDVIKKGNDTIADLISRNAAEHADWQLDRTAALNEDFAPLQQALNEKLSAADFSLAELHEKEKEFGILTSAAAANMLSKSFAAEAKSSRKVGLTLYGAGFLLLILAAVPASMLLFVGVQGEPLAESWPPLVIRISIGVILASAATVAIRLGSRFIKVSEDSKRTELELVAFGPFLANVDKADVDQARLAFIGRAFLGRVSSDTSKEGEEAIQVSAVSQLAETIVKIAQR